MAKTLERDLYYEFVLSPDSSYVYTEGYSSDAFRNARGSIDGSQIPLALKGKQAHRFGNRKGFISHNAFAVTDFDMNFRYILTSWKDSSHNSKVASNIVSKDFRASELGTYYLRDAGYGEFHGLFLISYKRVCYDLKK